MDMRGKLAEKVSEMMEDPSILCADDVAHLAIAALPDMVQALEWEDIGGGRFSAEFHLMGTYRGVYLIKEGVGEFVVKYGPLYTQLGLDTLSGHDSIQGAIEAANAHRRAQIMQAFGLEMPRNHIALQSTEATETTCGGSHEQT